MSKIEIIVKLSVEFDFETLAWISQRGSHIHIYIYIYICCPMLLRRYRQ